MAWNFGKGGSLGEGATMQSREFPPFTIVLNLFMEITTSGICSLEYKVSSYVLTL